MKCVEPSHFQYTIIVTEITISLMRPFLESVTIIMKQRWYMLKRVPILGKICWQWFQKNTCVYKVMLSFGQHSHGWNVLAYTMWLIKMKRDYKSNAGSRKICTHLPGYYVNSKSFLSLKGLLRPSHFHLFQELSLDKFI